MRVLKKIGSSTLFKITSLNSFSLGLKIGIGLITSKILAIFVGPGGMALVGNLRNFLTSLESISILGFQNGIIKYIAENQKNEEGLKKIITTVFISLICVALILSGILYFFASFWNGKILEHNADNSLVFKILALALPWYTVSVFLLAVLNGLSKFTKVIWVNITGNLIGLLVSLILVLKYHTLGALLAIVITPSLLFFITFYFVQKEIKFLKIVRLQWYDFTIIKNLLPYSLMALVSSVLGPIVLLAVRNNLIEKLGLDQAGFWETMTRISSYYLLFVSTILTVYFLPKLSKAQDNDETKSIFWQFYKTIFPFFCLGLIVIYFSRYFIIQLLFTKEFLPVTTLFFWQLIGDVFKAASLILGYQFFAKKLTKAFIISELFSLGTLYFLSLLFVNYYGTEGMVMAQALDNFLYFVVLVIYFRKSLI
ncbi:PST family polysaccharide transporter [Flavobacterium sp. HSC-32F16]|uniref:O-antigen translocase n=1 Tax=Flavobacterium sp. HSC-32F16 TaxID=2910964 RepID=UPI0020A50783|nr:O-antigen translocase [Flavobacterium sp. HSC-32F16]MCP2027241.1 PST family polysaccharide transporter [Flavobacterium sp. HSC-32F16]